MTIANIKRRVDKLASEIQPGQQFFHVTVKDGLPAIIPDEYEPGRDCLFITTYLGRDGKPEGGSENLVWRGKPHERESRP